MEIPLKIKAETGGEETEHPGCRGLFLPGTEGKLRPEMPGIKWKILEKIASFTLYGTNR